MRRDTSAPEADLELAIIDKSRLIRPLRRGPLLPNVVAGLVVGALASASLVPLLGAERSTALSSGASSADDLLLDVAGQDGRPPSQSLTGGADSAGAPLGAGSAGAAGTGDTSASGPRVGTDTDSVQARPTDQTARGTGSAGQAPRTASDIGITTDVIRIGLITLKCDQCAAVGVQTVDDAPIVRALEKDFNARGGVAGRRVVLMTADYDPVQDALGGGGSSREACLKLTQRDKVFAVAAGSLYANACIYDEHKTPLIADRDPIARDPQAFNRSGGRLWTLYPSTARTLLDWARQVPRQRLLPATSTRFGVVHSELHIEQMNQYLLPELRRLGYTPTRVSSLPSNSGTLAVKASQEVSAMRSAGVTHVLMATDYVVAAGFVREAERNDFRPQYLASDFPTAGQTFVGEQTAKEGTSWDGAIAVSSAVDMSFASLTSDALVKSCLDRYRRGGGNTVNGISVPIIYQMCLRLDRLIAAIERAGTNPTRTAVVQALATTGTFPTALFAGRTASWGGRYSLGAVRYSSAVRAVRKVWTRPCPYDRDQWQYGCYVQQGGPFDMAA